jgi:hypothetical protein
LSGWAADFLIRSPVKKNVVRGGLAKLDLNGFSVSYRNREDYGNDI